jgi:hypothetical protein
MMQRLFQFQTIAQDMIAADRERDQMLRAMDDMWHNRWSLPSNVAGLKWIHKVVSSDPHDAIRAGTRVLSSVAPRITVQPLGPSAENRAKAEKIERALSWHFRNASRRRRASVLRDVALSALLYDEVVAQVVYLPEQIAALKQFKNDGARLEAAQRFGPFAIIVRNPQQVHVRYSDWMPEAVLMKKVMPLQEAIDFWGAKAKKLTEAFEGTTNKRKAGGKGKKVQFTHCTVYDYMDLDQRAVWAVMQSDGGVISEPIGGEAGATEILREEHGLGFLPWAAKVGGTTLANSAGQQRIPLLYSVYQAKQWDTQNIVETLLTSEVIAYAAAPRLKVEGPSDSVEVDYGEPGRAAYVPPGHSISAMAPPSFDQGLAVIAQRVAERIGKSTVPRVLQTGDFPGGTAFATLNLATQSGIKSLAPYKELAEDALAEIFTLMLNWVQHSGEALHSYEEGKGHEGQQFSLSPLEFDLANLMIDVELTADVPTDRMARINAASMAVRELGYSRERALEQIGETDAKEVMRQAEQEELDELGHEIRKQRRKALAELDIQQMIEELKQEPETSVPTAGAPNPFQAVANNPRLMAKVAERLGLKPQEGQGMNPALGGSPAVMADPEAVAMASAQNAEKRQSEQ